MPGRILKSSLLVLIWNIVSIEYYKTRLDALSRKAGSGGDNAYYDNLMAELKTLSDSWHKADADLDDDEFLCLVDSKDSLERFLNKQKHICL